MTLAELLRNEMSGSRLIGNRTKLSTSDIKNIPLTLTDYDIQTDANGHEYCVITVVQYPENFIFGGTVLTDMCKIMAANGITADDLAKDPVAIILKDKLSKNNRSYTSVEIL